MSFNIKNIGTATWSALELFTARLGLAIRRVGDALRGRDDDFSNLSVEEIHESYEKVLGTYMNHLGEALDLFYAAKADHSVERLKVEDLRAQVRRLEEELDAALGLEDAVVLEEHTPARQLMGPEGAVEIPEHDAQLFDRAFEELRLMNEARSSQ